MSGVIYEILCLTMETAELSEHCLYIDWIPTDSEQTTDPKPPYLDLNGSDVALATIKKTHTHTHTFVSPRYVKENHQRALNASTLRVTSL